MNDVAEDKMLRISGPPSAVMMAEKLVKNIARV
jgi:hypothetical protein